jgi:transposase InsO family protein
MKERHEKLSIITLCTWFCISRQAYYQHEWNLTEEVFQSGLLFDEVKAIRKRHNRMGGRKLHELVRPFMEANKIKMGRDGFYGFLSCHGLLVRSRQRRIKTTNSFHWLKKYPNLIIDFVPSKPNELWVSDITYWKIKDRWFYISLITDAFSRKIVGYHLSENLHSEETCKALEMAFTGLKKDKIEPEQLIHHSDRGAQYCSSSYTNKLKKRNIKISMTQSGDPLENAIAERVNGIIKDEYLLNYKCDNIKEARKQLDMAVSLYNKERPHSSIGNLIPEFVHNNFDQIPKEKIKKLWKNYYVKENV